LGQNSFAPNYFSVKKLLPVFLIIQLISLAINTVYAQSTGKISGKITDKNTGEALIGATVLIQGSTKGAAADVNGGYLLAGIAPGTYTLLVRYVGYETKAISQIEIKPDLVTRLDINLTASQSHALNEVVVKATYKQESVSALYIQQKSRAQISDGISAEMIRRSPDRNTADVLKRVSGTSIQDGKFVVVRGLSERYNDNMLNNSVLPSTEPDKKAFAFDIIPSSLIDNIVVYKTATPDLPGDFAGGTVKTTTKDLPDSKFTEATVNIGYNSKTTFKKDFVGTEPKGGDFLGLGTGGRALPSAYSNAGSNYSSLPNSQKIEIAKQFPNTFGYQPGQNSLPNLSLQFTAGNSKITKNDNRWGYIFSVNYSTAHKIVTGNRIGYDPSNANLPPNYQFDRNNITSMKTLGGVFNLAYTYKKNKIAWRNFFNNDFSVDFEENYNGVNRFSGGDNTLYYGYSNQTTQSGLFTSSLEGTHTLGQKNIVLDWTASYGLSYRNQPDQRIVTLFNKQSTANQPYYFDISPENSPRPDLLGRIYTDLHENILGGGANLSVPFKWLDQSQKFKTGGLFNYRKRDFSTVALGYVNLVAFGGTQIPLSNGVTLDNIFSPESIQQNNLGFAKLDLSSTDYTGNSTLGAGYLMLENNFSDKLHLVWGARVEYFNQNLLAQGATNRNYNNLDVLPSGNLTYNLTAKTNLRASYYRSVNRPEFRELAVVRYYNYDTNFIMAGNPALVRSTIDNLDFRFEYYPSGGEIISLSAFYKYFNNPIEQVNESDANRILSYANAENAQDLGLELEIRKKLNFINEGNFFKNLTFYTNATVIKAKVNLPPSSSNVQLDTKLSTPLQGQSPYIINSGLSYALPDGGWSFNVLYNRIGERLQFRGQDDAIDIYERPRDVVDLQVSKRLIKNRAELKLTFSDLLHQATSLYYNYGSKNVTKFNPTEDRIIQQRYAGFGSVISFKYNFSSVK
jgi:TonB-dependent receptor